MPEYPEPVWWPVTREQWFMINTPQYPVGPNCGVTQKNLDGAPIFRAVYPDWLLASYYINLEHPECQNILSRCGGQ